MDAEVVEEFVAAAGDVIEREVEAVGMTVATEPAVVGREVETDVRAETGAVVGAVMEDDVIV